MSSLSVYCSGSIAKGAGDAKKQCWTDAERDQVALGAQPHDVVFLNPDDPITDPGNTLGQFGRDLYQVQVATAVVVDARERRGLGIGVEMAAAATLAVPVIVVAPRNSKYRSDELQYRGAVVKDYVHPHVASLAVAVVDDFVEAGRRLGELAQEKRSGPGSIPPWLTDAIDEYQKNVLPGDAPMLDAIKRLNLDRPVAACASHR
ncbi:hypothetical protein JOF53_001185 [Crossiella equi]|uniref:Nucleoside 2-deoxyribosyltransferase n=1 Tax=Crossiella equi TaxID=130796 RepID=A0ABS5A6U0_9PSEU|nr:hypothetical protein [Crossiella equi]MBP2472313.1 hypothetical protein [Crossiella equi]